MEHESNKPITPEDGPVQTLTLYDAPGTSDYLENSFENTQRLRHDGWDGTKMASFCQALAETGIVTRACMAAKMSAKSAYALRHRNPVFASAWDAALVMARARLADDLLARSLQGSQEIITRDGAIVGERHHFDNKLAFAVLRRLDRRAELGATFRTPQRGTELPPCPAIAGEWQPLLDAMSEDRDEEARRLLTPSPPESVEGDAKGNEGNNPLFLHGGEATKPKFQHERVWQTYGTDEWRTNYPPPDNFEGDEEGVWTDTDYYRTLTSDEFQALVDAGIAEGPGPDIDFDEDCIERDQFFSSLKERQDVAEARQSPLHSPPKSPTLFHSVSA